MQSICLHRQQAGMAGDGWFSYGLLTPNTGGWQQLRFISEMSILALIITLNSSTLGDLDMISNVKLSNTTWGLISWVSKHYSGMNEDNFLDGKSLIQVITWCWPLSRPKWVALTASICLKPYQLSLLITNWILPNPKVTHWHTYGVYTKPILERMLSYTS